MTEKQKPYGLLIVLAHWMESDGTLGDETQARVEYACQLFIRGVAEKMLLMGWDYRIDSSLCISDAMYRYIQGRYPIDREKILIDRLSRDTVGDAVFSKRNFACRVEPRAINVVTSDYHRARTREIFSFVYGDGWVIDVSAVATADNPEAAQREAASLEAFHRTFSGISAGDSAGIFEAMIDKHPYYNGAVYPKVALT